MTAALDPRTANVGFQFENLAGDPDYVCVGRVYYWHDPEGNLPPVADCDFRAQFPEIDDRDWEQLFYEAFDRAETVFLAESLKRKGLTEDEARQDKSRWQILMLGRTFGPRPPREGDAA